MSSKPFKQHLDERMITSNDVLGFLLAAYRDSEAGDVEAAVEMLLRIAMDRELAGTLYRADLPRATTEAELTVESALEELREMFPLRHNETWYDFEVRARVYHGDGHEYPFRVVMFHIDGVGRRLLERTWSGHSVDACMNQIRAWSKSRAQKEGERAKGGDAK